MGSFPLRRWPSEVAAKTVLSISEVVTGALSVLLSQSALGELIDTVLSACETRLLAIETDPDSIPPILALLL